MMEGSASFQSNDVSGAQNSVFLFCRARAGQGGRGAGVSIHTGAQAPSAGELLRSAQPGGRQGAWARGAARLTLFSRQSRRTDLLSWIDQSLR